MNLIQVVCILFIARPMVSFPDVLQGHDVGPAVTVPALLYSEPFCFFLCPCDYLILYTEF